MTTNIVLAFLLVGNIATFGCLYYMTKRLENNEKAMNLLREYAKTCGDLSTITANEQDKIKFRLKAAEERILNLQNRTGQIQIKLRQMDNNTIYEVKDGE